MKIKTVNYCQGKILHLLSRNNSQNIVELATNVLGPSHYDTESETNFNIALEILRCERQITYKQHQMAPGQFF